MTENILDVMSHVLCLVELMIVLRWRDTAARHERARWTAPAIGNIWEES